MILLDPGFLCTVQDLGRAGCQAQGVPVSGALDRFALMAANALVGNPLGAAGLECACAGCVLEAEEETLAAAAGRGFRLRVGGRDMPAWMAALVRPGERVELLAGPDAGWGCLAFAGGIDTPPALGARATCLRGGFGGLEGRALRPGDRLPLGPAPADLRALAGRSLPPSALPPYGERVLIPAVPGPQAGAFTPAALETFFSAEYTLSPLSDRMGARLVGPPLAHRAGADLLSEGVAEGSVQVPGDGLPVVLLADAQATGGYPKIAVLARAGLPLLAQLRPGEGRARFAPVTPAEAQRMWRRLVEGIRF